MTPKRARFGRVEIWFRERLLDQEWRWQCPKCLENGLESVTDLTKVIRTLSKDGKPHRPESYYKRWENRCHKHTRTRMQWSWLPKFQ